MAGLAALLLCATLCPPAVGQDAATPADVHRILSHAADHVGELRELAGVDLPWPSVRVDDERFPHHVLQKTHEVLQKINLLRQNRGTGAITIPRYPSRPITPDEVLLAAERVLRELEIILDEAPDSLDDAVKRPVAVADNYAMLSEISLALDPVLGVRGFTPGDVYSQSVRVLEHVKFLRMSQNLPMDIEYPPARAGMHPNHALQAAVRLLEKTALAERGLWMRPCQTPSIPKRKIDPNEVHDMLQIVLAEQQRIKYRLGLERHFQAPPVQVGKTPADVVRNLEWAEAMMPEFSIKKALVQYDPSSLRKTPSDVYAVAAEVSERLQAYRAARGIRVAPRSVTLVPGRQPKHVYGKTLECLEKINRLRERVGLGRTAVLEFPLREITPREVYDLVIRLNEELDLVGNHCKLDLGRPTRQAAEPGRTPSDVYRVMSRNAHLLDTLIGPQGYTPSDVHRRAERIVREFELLRLHLGITSPVATPPLVAGKEPRHVIEIAHEIIRLMLRVQRRAGMAHVASAPTITSETVTSNEVFNEVGIILAEIVSLKVQLGIRKMAAVDEASTDKTPSHVYKEMEHARRLLASVLGLDTTGNEALAEAEGRRR